jgi:hypothetical protein
LPKSNFPSKEMASLAAGIFLAIVLLFSIVYVHGCRYRRRRHHDTSTSKATSLSMSYQAVGSNDWAQRWKQFDMRPIGEALVTIDSQDMLDR